MPNPVFVPALLVGDAANVTSTTVILGSIGYKYLEVSADYTPADIDRTITVSQDGVTISLPTAVGILGREYVIKNSSSGDVKISTFFGESVDGVPGSFTIVSLETLRIISTDVGWIRV